jgi:glycosyltransferase involved in cell wall biosynthesis
VDVVIDDLGHVVPWISSAFRFRTGIVFFRHLHARTLPGQVAAPAAAFLTGLEHLYPALYPDRDFVTESEASLMDLASLGVAASRTHKIPPGVDSDLFHPTSKTRDPGLVYFAGFRESKRPDHALRVFQSVRRAIPQAKLVMFGDGPALRASVRLSEGMGLAEAVSFPGRVDPSTLAAGVGRAWLNLHCSVAEGWGYSVLEAAAAGVPTVAYRVPGVSEALSDGISGRLVTDASVEAMSRAAVEILEGGPDQWAQRCRGWASKFSWALCSGQWETLLRSLA